MYSNLQPILSTDPGASWLTIGDSGADAAYIRGHSSGPVAASSITRAQLDAVAGQGYLDGIEIQEINAEKIDLPDHCFDYVYCKEAYHHFPRPPVAFYEMMRIARKAVVLCEPSDPYPRRLLDVLRAAAKYVLRGQSRQDAEFEEAGNFVFRISLQEIRKMATAVGYDRVYWRYFNDLFIRGLAGRPRTEALPGFILKLGICLQDVACSSRLMNWGLCTTAIWILKPSDQTDIAFNRSGFHRFDVPENPYVPATSSLQESP